MTLPLNHSTPLPAHHSILELDRLLGRKEVLTAVGISNATLWRWTKSGRFPEPLKIGARKTAWRLSVVRGWIDAQTEKAAALRS